MRLAVFKALRSACVVALTAVLVACGGGGGGGGGGAAGGAQTIGLDVDLAYAGDLELFHATTLTPVFTGIQGFTPQCVLQGHSLPTGLSIRPDCTIVGTPTQAGVFDFVIRVSAAGVGNTIDFIFRFDIASPGNSYTFPTPFVTGFPVDLAPSLGDWTRRAGDVLTYSLVGTLPPGLALDTATGRLSGTPTQAGTWSFSIQANLATSSGSLALLVASSPGVVGTSGLTYPNIGTVWAGAPFSAAPLILPSAGPWTYTADVLPTGLTLDPATGVISGTPTVVQPAAVPSTITATQAGTGLQFQATVPFQVPSPLTVVYPVRNVTVGSGVSYLPVLTNETSGVLGGWTLTYSVAQGSSLPPNVILDPSLGQIVGIPTAPASPGLIDVTVSSNGTSFHLLVNNNLTVTP